MINREDFETLQKACRGIRVTYVSTYVKINTKFERKIVNIFLSINLNISFGCSGCHVKI